MTAELPPQVRDVVDRIEVAPKPDPADPRTAALGRLAAWWDTFGPGTGAPPVPADLEVPGLVGRSDGLTPHERYGEAAEDAVLAGLVAGIVVADRAVDAGATLLVVAPTGQDDVPARAVIALRTRREASAVLPQPAGMTDREWMARCEMVRDLAAAGQPFRGDPVAMLAATGATGLASAAGTLLAAAARRTPCLIDGTAALAAAVVADRLAYRARGWWLAASDSSDPARSAAIDRIDLAVALPLGLADDDALGARAVLALLGTSDLWPQATC